MLKEKNQQQSPRFWRETKPWSFCKPCSTLELFGNEHKLASGKTRSLQTRRMCVRFPARCKPVRDLSISRWKTFVSLLCIWSSVKVTETARVLPSPKILKKVPVSLHSESKRDTGGCSGWEFLSGGNWSEVGFVAALNQTVVSFRKGLKGVCYV